jgi:hypothetical protein
VGNSGVETQAHVPSQFVLRVKVNHQNALSKLKKLGGKDMNGSLQKLFLKKS